MKWRLAIPPFVQEELRPFPPETKRYVRQAFRELQENPKAGKPLRDKLSGLHSFPTRRFRIVYEIKSDSATVRVLAVGRRETVYEELQHAGSKCKPSF